MPKVRILDRDPATGITRWFHPASDGESFTVQTSQDVTQLIRQNRALQNEPQKWRDLTRVASLPLNVYFDLRKQGVIDDPKALRKWLNDPDNRYFRTREGVV